MPYLIPYTQGKLSSHEYECDPRPHSAPEPDRPHPRIRFKHAILKENTSMLYSHSIFLLASSLYDKANLYDVTRLAGRGIFTYRLVRNANTISTLSKSLSVHSFFRTRTARRIDVGGRWR
jgi:hypothetical protein